MGHFSVHTCSYSCEILLFNARIDEDTFIGPGLQRNSRMIHHEDEVIDQNLDLSWL